MVFSYQVRPEAHQFPGLAQHVVQSPAEQKKPSVQPPAQQSDWLLGEHTPNGLVHFAFADRAASTLGAKPKMSANAIHLGSDMLIRDISRYPSQ